MPITIPLTSKVPHFDLSIQLEGVTYRMEFRWNARNSGWFLSLYTIDGDPIFEGVRVVVDFPLGFRSRVAARPLGAMVAVDTGGEREDPGLNDLGDRVQLLYYDSTELPVDPDA